MIPCWTRLPSRKDKQKRRSFTPLSEDGTQSLVQLTVAKLISMPQQYLRNDARAGKNHLAHLAYPTPFIPSSKGLTRFTPTDRSPDPPITRSTDPQIHRSPDPQISRSPDPQISRSPDPVFLRASASPWWMLVLDQFPNPKGYFFPIHRSPDLPIHRSPDSPITR
jgi:hypothetical protein